MTSRPPIDSPGAGPRNGRDAFTLVELLVVVGVIALLAGLLLPALGRARQSGLKSACLSNLRQLGFAWRMYLDDSGSRFPDLRPLKSSLPEGYRPWTSWPPSDPRAGWAVEPLQDYLGGGSSRTWTCPGLTASRLSSAPQSRQLVPPFPGTTQPGSVQYWMWRFDRPDDPIPLDNFWGKSEAAALDDLRAAHNPIVGQPAGPSDVELVVDVYFPRTVPSLPDELRGHAAHPGGRNRLQWDGHVQHVRDPRTR